MPSKIASETPFRLSTACWTHPHNSGSRMRLRCGIVGLGRQARNDHIPAVSASEYADLVAVCDVDEDTTQEIGAQYGVNAYCSFADMIAAESLDFVVVAVPHHAGAGVVSVAAQHGVHVLKEKPFATSLDEARDLAKVCADAGVELMITMQRRFNPIYTTFHQLYDQIGEPFLVDVRYTMHVDPAAGWRGQLRLAGGGCIIDMGYHVIDMLLWYFGLPTRVFAQCSATARPDLDYDAEDTACISLSYDSGLFGSVLLSRCIAPKTESIRVMGTRGVVEVQRGRIQRIHPDGQVIESLSREQSWPSAATVQVDHFCRVIRGERANLATPESHLAHAAFIEAAYASAERGCFVNPKELMA